VVSAAVSTRSPPEQRRHRQRDAGVAGARSRRSALDHESPRDRLSQLARRAIATYAERAVLLHKSRALWRMGQGSPALRAAHGGGYPDLTIQSIKVIRGLVEHEKFVFVTSEPAARDLLTIGRPCIRWSSPWSTG
jgi:hypothetical protein